MRLLSLAVALVVLLASSPALAGEITLKGKVLDAKGKPVKGVDVSATWLEGTPYQSARTPADGSFELKARHFGRSLTILAMNKKRSMGATAVIESEDIDKPIQLALSKLVHVHGTFTCEDLNAKPTWTNVYLNFMPGRLRIARFSSEKAEFSFRVPEGTYQLHMYGTDVQGLNRSLDIEEDTKAELDLGALDLKATAIAKLYGKELPPWTVTDARGVAKDVKLEDYRGKWVLIEFWFST